VLLFALQTVQSPGCGCCFRHFVFALGKVESGQLFSQLYGMVRLDSGLAAGPVEPLQSGVPERLDHSFTVSLRFAVVNASTDAFGQGQEPRDKGLGKAPTSQFFDLWLQRIIL
jgi:hypothetical protein